MMKLFVNKIFICLSLFILGSLCCANISDAYLSTGRGSSIIENNNLKKAEREAYKRALENAISNFYKQYNRVETIPSITGEFFKFINSYKILNRYVDDFTVYYEIEADVQKVDLKDLSYTVKNIKDAVVYFLDITGNVSVVKQNELGKIASDLFNKYNFSTDYQKEFSLSLGVKPRYKDLVDMFANTGGKFLFDISVKYEIDKADMDSICKMEMLTKIYTREKRMPPIKYSTSVIKPSIQEALLGAFTKSWDKTLEYVTSNIIKPPEKNTRIIDYNIIALNYKTYSEVMDLINSLEDKGLVDSYKLVKYNHKEILFNIKTKSDIGELSEKIKGYHTDYPFSVEILDGSILVDFYGKKEGNVVR